MIYLKNYKEEEIAIGFIDEARPQNTANTVKTSNDAYRAIVAII